MIGEPASAIGSAVDADHGAPRVRVVGGVRLGVAVTARTPASSANLGPGFDSLGLALALYDEVTVQAAVSDGRRSVQVEVIGEGAGTLPLGEDHLVVRSVRAGLAHAGAGRPALRLSCRNAIPHGRGLGSSAAAIAIGLVLARGLLADPALLDDEAVFALASAAEGHPDNAAAALYGGFTVAWTDPPAHGHPGSGGPHGLPQPGMVRLDVDPRVQAVVCVPDAELPTSKARAMLPATVPHADAAFNAGRAALLVEALTRRPELLLAATEDRLHQGQRAPAMPGTAALIRAIRQRAGAAVVSGAGPSVLVLGVGDAAAVAVGAALAAGPCADPDLDSAGGWGSWRVLSLPIDRTGTTTTAAGAP